MGLYYSRIILEEHPTTMLSLILSMTETNQISWFNIHKSWEIIELSLPKWWFYLKFISNSDTRNSRIIAMLE